MKVKYFKVDSYFIMYLFLTVFQNDVMKFYMKKELPTFTILLSNSGLNKYKTVCKLRRNISKHVLFRNIEIVLGTIILISK